MTSGEILECIQILVKEEYLPRLKDIETWSERMRADIKKWIYGEISEPDFMRHYKRKL